jgi:hypothetical protein
MKKFEDFVAEIKAAFEAEYPDREVTVCTVTKTNGIKLTGMSLRHKDQELNASPTVYLEEPYGLYQNGRTIAEIVKDIRRVIDKNGGFAFDVTRFTDWEKVKEHGLVMKLVSEETNKELLSDTPHRQFCGPYNIIYKYLVGMEDGQGSITIRNSHMNSWGVSEEDLYQLAIKDDSDVSITSMENMMRSILGVNQVDSSLKTGDWRDESSLCGVPMYVCSNANRIDGAAVIAIPGVLQEMADVFQSDLYIIPSSIHEVIILPVRIMGNNAPDLVNMIREVNDTEVAPGSVLGNDLMFYDRENEELRIYVKNAPYEPETL